MKEYKKSKQNTKRVISLAKGPYANHLLLPPNRLPCQ